MGAELTTVFRSNDIHSINYEIIRANPQGIPVSVKWEGLWDRLSKETEASKKQWLYHYVCGFPQIERLQIGYRCEKDSERLHTINCIAATESAIARDRQKLAKKHLVKQHTENRRSRKEDMELERKQISSNQEEDVEKINRKINQRNLVLLHKKHCHLEMQLKCLPASSHPAEKMVINSRIKSIKLLLEDKQCGWQDIPNFNWCEMESCAHRCID